MLNQQFMVNKIIMVIFKNLSSPNGYYIPCIEGLEAWVIQEH